MKASAFAEAVSGRPCTFILDTGQRPFHGGECIIFALVADTGQRFAIRTEQRLSSTTRMKVESEVELLQAIRKQNIAHLPFLIGFDLDSGPPFIATTWANGRALQWSDASPPRPVRNEMLMTIAGVNLDMLEIRRSGELESR